MCHLKKKKNVIELCQVLGKNPTNQVSTACRFLISMTHSMKQFLHCTDFKDINQECFGYSLNLDMNSKEDGVDIVCFPFFPL